MGIRGGEGSVCVSSMVSGRHGREADEMVVAVVVVFILVVVVVTLILVVVVEVVVSEGAAGGKSQHGFLCTAVFLPCRRDTRPQLHRLQGLRRQDVSGVCNSNCMKTRIILCYFPPSLFQQSFL